MQDLVGEWKSFTFKLIETCDYDDVLKHLRENFYQDEPLCQLMGYSEEAAASFDRIILVHLAHHLSFCAIHIESKKIAGVRIIYQSTQDEYSSSPFPYRISGTMTADNIVHQFLTELEDKCNIFQMYGITTCAQLWLTSVARQFRSQGLATEMYKRSIAYLTRLGFTMAKGCFSSKQTRHIATKYGLKELARTYMKDFRNKDGVYLFPNSESDQFVALLAIRL